MGGCTVAADIRTRASQGSGKRKGAKRESGFYARLEADVEFQGMDPGELTQVADLSGGGTAWASRSKSRGKG